LAREYETSGYGKFKGDLAEALVEHLRPIQEKLLKLKQDRSFVKGVLDQGNQKAEEIANVTKKEIFDIVGLNG
jgi:tryptophanyl-tRNA synthetase